jgi:RpiR family carbohydrate utilization transcriptional regulator
VSGATGKALVGEERLGVVPGVRALLPSLNRSDALVARVVVEDPMRVVHLSVQELAQEAGVAPSSVVRCCQRLGFRGFQQLKIALAQDLGAARVPGGGPWAREGEASPGGILQGVFSTVSRTLEDSLSTLSEEGFAAAVPALREAKKVLFVGVGTSAPLAQDGAYRFATIGVDAEAPPDVHTQHVKARLLSEGDVCLAVSHTGSTTETVSSVRSAKGAGALVIAVTSFSRSPLTEHADVVLVAGGPEDSFRLEAMTSRVAHLCVLDALFLAVARSDVERANAALDAYADVLAEHRY